MFALLLMMLSENQLNIVAVFQGYGHSAYLKSDYILLQCIYFA